MLDSERTYFDQNDVPNPKGDWRDIRTYLVACTDTALSASNYIGDRRPNGMASAFIGRHRDSDCLDESNYRTALMELEGISDATTTHGAGHWAVGWVEAIYVPLTEEAMIRVAELHASLCESPVLDESDYSELELEQALNWYDSSGFDDVLSQTEGDIHYDYYDLPKSIQDDLMEWTGYGYFTNGYSEEEWNEDAGLDAFNDRCAQWIALGDWISETYSGRQVSAFPTDYPVELPPPLHPYN